MPLEFSPAHPRFGRRIKLFHQLEKTALQFVNAHVLRLKIDVEQCASLPGELPQNPPFRLEARVKRGSRKGRHKRHLDFIQSRFTDEIQHGIKDFRRVAIKAEDETAIHRNTVRLDFGDRVAVMILLA